jgi:uncharacterized protein (DUF58 family)
VLTPRGAGVLGGAVLLYAASRAFGIAELQLAAVAAVGLVVAAAAFTWSTSAALSVHRSVRPGRLHLGAEAVVVLTVRNVGRLPTATLELRDRVPSELAADPRPILLPPLSAGARTVVRVRIRGDQRGHHRVGPLTVSCRDPFRLVARARPLPGDVEVVVYPAVHRLPAGLPLGGAQTSGAAGTSRPTVSGDDRSTVREYVQGDDLRSVHWASTAHRGKLMVRQAEARQEPRAVILLDVRADRHRGYGLGASLETAVAATASAAFHLDGRGRGVVIVDAPLTAAPRTRSADTWLDHLASVAPGRVDHDQVLRQLGQGLAGDGALVAVVTVPGAGELRALVRAGRAFTSRVALLVDVDRHGGRGRPGRSADEVAATAAQLRAAGWRVAVLTGPNQLPERWRELVAARPGARPAGVS